MLDIGVNECGIVRYHGKLASKCPLFDHNMACLPMMMEGDDFEEYVSLIGPKIGTDFRGHRARAHDADHTGQAHRA